MIPKVIHYCWFGGQDLPAKYKKYIESWRKYLPDYEIRRWDESNFDINSSQFTIDAYADKKMALVSDYARLKIMYEHGGVYFDTDVEMIAPIDDLIEKGPFMGFEKNSNVKKGETLNVAVGLGFAVEPGNPIIKEAVEYYDSISYKDCNTIVVTITNILKHHGLKRSDIPITIQGITIYPWDYFCPVEFLSSKIEISDNTRTIHHYSASWMSWTDKLKMYKGYYASKIRRLLNLG